MAAVFNGDKAEGASGIEEQTEKLYAKIGQGKSFTTPYVVIHKDGNILIDGHHSVIVKKTKGKKYVYANCYYFN